MLGEFIAVAAAVLLLTAAAIAGDGACFGKGGGVSLSEDLGFSWVAA